MLRREEAKSFNTSSQATLHRGSRCVAVVRGAQITVFFNRSFDAKFAVAFAAC